MKPYFALVHKDAESTYGITFPDAPGCFSACDELDQLFANAAQALQLWLDGMMQEGYAIAGPRDLSSLQQDADWAESFAAAALVITVEAPAAVRKAA